MEEDDDTLCKYGTPLPTYEEDEIPAKKPVSVEDQIVLDSNGKRRFHGAFTGGFSAGYWNTVGSHEGWTPSEFKSSRAEKATRARAQNPMDFMDDEDLGEFGIAPQRVQAREDFAATAGSSKGNKRRAQNWSGGPIPGQPVLKALLEPAREKTAVKMLKRMGWREGQGIGERQSSGEKKKAKERNRKETYVMKMYGCEIPGRGSPKGAGRDSDSGESDESEDYEVSFAPDDFDPLVAAIKDNTFGLGYSGLDRGTGSGAKRFNLFETLEIVDRNNKKLSIRGQAFGVGALEEDDEDIYAKDDMSRYDFSLEDRAKKPAAIKSKEQAGVLDGFCTSKKTGKQMKKVFKVKVPESFAPRNWTLRKSRFEPMEGDRSIQFEESNRYKVQGLGRHDLNPEQRGQALGEVPLAVVKEPLKNPILEMINQRAQNFVSGEVINSDQDKPTVPKKDPLKFDLKAETSNLGSTGEGFKPFIADPDKQERYEKFLSFKPCEKYKIKEDFLNSLQPLGMSSWDREREFKEFAQAQRMYRPLDGLMSDRFVTESNLIAEKEVAEANKSSEVRLKRTRGMWKPHKDLCKRFNVPEPFGGMLEEEKKVSKTKFSVFDYLEAPVNSRKDFVTPVVIPKQVACKNDAKPVRASAKDFFAPPPSAPPPQEPFTSRAKPSQPPPPPKKPEKLTPLEQQVLDSVNKKPEEKKDLFKSIFCSSDEEDGNDDDANNPLEPQPSNPSSEADKLKLVESLVAIKPASEVNVLRNNSPPRGIFASIFDIQKSAVEKKPQSVDSSSSSSEEEDAYYGPKLPQGVGGRATTSSTRGDESGELLDTRLKEMMQKVGARNVVEEWVEKGKSSSSSKGKKKKHKEHKKSKKHKKEKKKHKHKDKK